MTKPRSEVIVLDTWAMIAYLNEEPGAQEVRRAFRKANRREVLVLFSIINYGECLYTIERKDGFHKACYTIGIVDSLPLSVVPADRPLVFAAARMKARYPISYADAFSAALAKMNGARLITGDPGFKAVAHEIKIHWLPVRRRTETATLA